MKLVSGIQVPYATLEYVWGAGAPTETVVINSYTPRIRTLLVQNSPQPLNEWVTETRDVVEDFRRAFGEEPGRITARGRVYRCGRNRRALAGLLRRPDVPHAQRGAGRTAGEVAEPSQWKRAGAVKRRAALRPDEACKDAKRRLCCCKDAESAV